MQAIALGELQMSVEEFGNATMKEIEALAEGYRRRHEAQEDLFILWSALPMYQTHCKKPPTYKKLTAHRSHLHNSASINENDQKFWRKVLADIGC